VLHRRASFLALGQSFSSPPARRLRLQVQISVEDTLQGGANQSQGLTLVGMPIAADHLVLTVSGTQTKPLRSVRASTFRSVLG